VRNADLGIEAVRGVIDGGGNRASGNGHGPQCRHVACGRPSSPGRAAASHVSCGDTITADTTLDSDIVNCADNGIVIGADNVTLDLNGHTIDGDNELVDRCPREQMCDTGIVSDGHDGVTVEGGAVKQFGTGIFILRAKGANLRAVTASRNTFNGILLGDSTRSAILGSAASANGLETDYPGIALFGSDHNLVKGTTSSGNADLGFFVVESDHNRFLANTLSDNPEAGAIIEGDDNEISRNRVVRNGDGIILSGSGNTVSGNQIIKPFGYHPGCGVGISLEDGHGNLIAGNEVRDAQDAGIRLSTFVKRQQLRDNIVRRNRIKGAGRNGVLVDATAASTLLERNHVRGAGADGIHVDSRSATLTPQSRQPQRKPRHRRGARRH
jgi:parallel beta-helix repeat protein